MRTRVQSLALLSGLRIWVCRELWCRLQMLLWSGVAVAQAGSCSSNSTAGLGISTCCRYGLKKQKKIFWKSVKKGDEIGIYINFYNHKSSLHIPSLFFFFLFLCVSLCVCLSVCVCMYEFPSGFSCFQPEKHSLVYFKGGSTRNDSFLIFLRIFFLLKRCFC